MLNNLQVLRAVAALLVVLAHSAELNPPLLDPLFRFGVRGVDIFFVISGFVMVHTTRKRPPTPVRFMVNRVIRIVPLYWTMTIAVFVVAVLAPHVVKATRPDLAELLKSLVFIPFVKSNGLMQPMLFVGWTLNYEMFFYALFALSLLLPSATWRVGALSAVLILLVTAGALLHPHDQVVRFYTAPIQIEFAIGMVLASCHPLIERSPSFPIASAALLVLGAFLVALGPGRLAITVGSALIVYGAVALEAGNRRYAGRGVLLLGAASYALYLTHPFPLALVQKFGPRSGSASWWDLAMLVTLYLALAAAAGIAVHLAYERPLGERLRNLLPHRTRGDAATLWPWRLRAEEQGSHGSG